MSIFDPWTATLQQAEEQPNAHKLQGALAQWHAAQKLSANKEKIPFDGVLVLWAVSLCALHDLVMPEWLAIAYLKRYRAVVLSDVDSWDDEKAFGRPYPKGTQIHAQKRNRINSMRVVLAVADAIDRNPECVLDVFFWEQIGKAIGEGKTNAQKLHASAVRRGVAIEPKERKRALLNNGIPTKYRKVAGLLRRL